MAGMVSVWNALTLGKRLMLIGAVAGTIFAFSLLARTASTPPMALLYSGLDARASGEVLGALERMSVATEVRGDSIYVPSSRRDFVRMSLAREGLPNQGQVGFELLEDLNSFSTTSEVFDVTYWRAVEGELARTVLATPGVRSARVHIAHNRGKSFSRRAPEPKAAVTVTMGRGALSSAHANSIRYLVSSTVPGLAAEQVAVIDADRGVVLSPGKLEDVAGGQSNFGDRERKMEADILNLLEARVGAGNARVQVALDIDTEREAISERVFDPAGRIITGKETKEVTEKSSGANQGSISVASNLPEGDENASGARSSTDRTETNEILRYDTSEIRREREKLPGSIRRMSIAVLVNDIAGEGGGETTQRSEEELAALRELVSMASGYNEERGDTLTIQNLAFLPIESDEGSVVEADAVGDFFGKHLMTIIQIAILSIVTLVLGLFVVKPVMSVENLPAPEESAAPAVAAPETAPMVASAPLEELPMQGMVQDENPFNALQGIAHERSDEAASVIKEWLDEKETAA